MSAKDCGLPRLVAPTAVDGAADYLARYEAMPQVAGPAPVAGPRIAVRLSAIFRQSRQAAKSLELSTIVVLSGLALIAYFDACRFFAPQVSAWVMAAIFVSATISGVAGFAFSAICGAMLFHLLARPVGVVETMMICSIAIQIFSVMTLKNAIDLKPLGRFLLGGAVGLPIGVWLLMHMSGSIYMKCIGGFLIAYGAYMMARRPAAETRRAPDAGDYVAGLLGGITGGFAAFPGAFVTIWCSLKGLPKDQQRGVYQPYILIMQVLALAVLFVAQTTHPQTEKIDLLAAAYIPAALLGTWCGIAIFRRLTDIQFAWSVNLLLVASGLGLAF